MVLKWFGVVWREMFPRSGMRRPEFVVSKPSAFRKTLFLSLEINKPARSSMKTIYDHKTHVGNTLTLMWIQIKLW